jgi:hypothetical protein
MTGIAVAERGLDIPFWLDEKSTRRRYELLSLSQAISKGFMIVVSNCAKSRLEPDRPLVRDFCFQSFVVGIDKVPLPRPDCACNGATQLSCFDIPKSNRDGLVKLCHDKRNVDSN